MNMTRINNLRLLPEQTGGRAVLSNDPASSIPELFRESNSYYVIGFPPAHTDGQFHDIGLSYQAAIYYQNEEEKKIAEASKEKLGKSGKFDQPIVTEILPAKPFYPAEDYHQKYYQKNPADYEAYHVGSGRVSYLAKIWGKP